MPQQIKQKTKEITKEQILEKHSNVRIFDQFYDGKQNITVERSLKAMQEFCDQELAKERERSEKLAEAVKSFVQASDDFNFGYINRNGEITRCGIAALSLAMTAAEKRLRLSLTEYEKL